MIAIRKHLRDFAAIIALIVIAFAVASVILANQRLALPGWVPVLGQDFTRSRPSCPAPRRSRRARARRSTWPASRSARSRPCGWRAAGRSSRSKLRKDAVPVYRDATVLLRPKTGLKDMVAELTPGTRAAGELPARRADPDRADAPDVNLDEILAALDTDTRDYLRLLLTEGGKAIGGQQPRAREHDPPVRADRASTRARSTRQLAVRRKNIRRVIHNFSLVAGELGGRDDQVAAFVESSNAVFAALARQDAGLRATLRQLPATLTDHPVGADQDQARSPTCSGPTLEALRPGARALGPALSQTRPFLRKSTPVIRDELRPFVRAALPTVTELRPALSDLAAPAPNLTRTFDVVNELRRPLALQPGRARTRRATCSGCRGSTTSAPTLFSTPGRAGPDPARRRRASARQPASAGRTSSRAPIR